MDFSIVSGKVVHDIIHSDLRGCARIVDRAYLLHHHGKTVNPPSHFLRFPDRPTARIIGLPASIGDDFEVSGLKWIASYPENVKHGIPRASAVLILNRLDNGYPFACLEASVISAARTAASAVIAARHLLGGRARVGTLGYVGTGFIARYVHRFMIGLGWEIDATLLHDAAPAEAERFRTSVLPPGAKVTLVDDPAEVVRRSEMTVFATTSRAPYLVAPHCLDHNPVVLHLSLRDISPGLILRAQNVVDDVNHVLTAETSVHLAEQTRGDRSFITGTLAGLMLREYQVDRQRPIIFSPFGLGVLDLAVGKWVYERAVARREHHPIEDFFYDLSR